MKAGVTNIENDELISNEVISLASSIRKNMVDPTGRRLEDLEERVCLAERAVVILNRAFFASAVIFTIALGTIIYHLSTK